MLAVDVNVDSLGQPGVEAVFPRGQLLGSVVFEAQARICEVGGEHVRRGLLLGFR